MTKAELKELADQMFWAGSEITEDFDNFGEVLQQDDSFEYGADSSIGKLKTALTSYRESRNTI